MTHYFVGRATALLTACAVAFTNVDVTAFASGLLSNITMQTATQAETKANTETEAEIEVTEVTEINALAEEVSVLTESDDLDIDSEYATKRLIVVSDTAEFDNFSASSIVCYDNIYILSYDTRKACKSAYQKLQESKVIQSVEVDSVMETETNSDAVVSDVCCDDETHETHVTDTELKKYLDSLTATTDVKVAILDTGIDTSNQLFGDIIDLGINLSSSGEANSIMDDNGHGTEMATIIVANSNAHVKLMPIKVANSDGKATVLSTYLGIQQAMENGADVINISMNAAKSASSEILTSVINEATEKGIAVVISAGNNEGDTNNYTPANIESAIVVSAVDAENVFADYSNHGTTVDYAACGVYNDKTGTSYAAANVTGMIADVLSKNQTVDKLNEYAIDLGDTGVDVYYGNGYLGYTMCTQSDDKDDCNDDDCNTDDSNKTVGSAVNSLGNNYVLVGDTSFDITQDFSHIDYNSDAYTARYVSSSPEFDVNKTGTYSVTYEFVDKNDENYVETCIRDVTVTDDKEFIDSFESLAVSETYSTVKVSNNVRYTAWTSYTGNYFNKQYTSGSNLERHNAAMYTLLDYIATNQTDINNAKWSKCWKYGFEVYTSSSMDDVAEPIPDSDLDRWFYVLLGRCSSSNDLYFTSFDAGDTLVNTPFGSGVAGTTLKSFDFAKLRNVVASLDANGAVPLDVVKDAVNKTYAYKTYFSGFGTQQQDLAYNLFCNIYVGYFGLDMLNVGSVYDLQSAKGPLLSSAILSGQGPVGYGKSYRGVNNTLKKWFNSSGVAQYTDSTLTSNLSKDQKAIGDFVKDASNINTITGNTNINAVKLASNVLVYNNSTWTGKMTGSSCKHAGSYGAVIACESSTGAILNKQALSVGHNTTEDKSFSFTFNFSDTEQKGKSVDFYVIGVAYACPFAATYITTTGNYSLTVPTYRISLVDRLNNTSGAYYEKYGYGNYDSDAADANLIKKVTPPSKDGYIFDGYYYTDTDGTEKQCVDANGTILSTATTFTCDKQAFAKWIPITSTLIVYPDSPDAVSAKPEWAATWNGSSDKQELEGKYTESIEIPLPQKIGYTFVKWLSNPDTLNGTLSSFTVAATYAYGTVKDAIDTITAMWKANDDTKYVVKHYLQDLNYNAETYTLKDTQNLTGTTDAWLNVADLKNSYDHFTYKEGKVNNQVVDKAQILPDGSLEINLYYTRDKYKIETSAEGSGSIDATITGIFYDDTKTISYKSANDCYLQYLVVDGTKITGKDLNAYLESYEFANISKDHEIKAVFKPIPKITITNEITANLSNIDVPWNLVSTFMISGTDYLGNSHLYYRSITNDGSVTLKVPAGTYTVSQLGVDRWKQTAVTSVAHCTVSGVNGVCDTSDYDASVKFTNGIADWSEYSDNDVSIQ